MNTGSAFEAGPVFSPKSFIFTFHIPQQKTFPRQDFPDSPSRYFTVIVLIFSKRISAVTPSSVYSS